MDLVSSDLPVKRQPLPTNRDFRVQTSATVLWYLNRVQKLDENNRRCVDAHSLLTDIDFRKSFLSKDNVIFQLIMKHILALIFCDCNNNNYNNNNIINKRYDCITLL